MKINIRYLTPQQLSQELAARDLPGYRAGQISEWIARGALSFDEMTNLPKTLRSELGENFCLISSKIEKRLVSSVDDTVKYLYTLQDGEYVESVVMKYKHGYSICISTQAGCRMGCAFCASTRNGLTRNLEAHEMLDQILLAAHDRGIRIDSLVLMGIGEPLDNYDNVLKFLRLLSSPQGLEMSLRHVSLSTCGLVDKIYQLAEQKLQLTLSVSLHAPDDATRGKMMPVNRRWGVDELLEACRYYAKVTGRRISFEYAMVSGVNDSPAHAALLAKKLKGMLCHVNLIPLNEVRETGLARSSKAQMELFERTLTRSGITTTVRRTLGSDINASCGQLRNDKIRRG